MKPFFVFQPDHVLDIITNSSSELSVLKGQTLSAVQGVVAGIYDNYLSEYKEIKPTSELTNDELHTYLDYASTEWPSLEEQLSGSEAKEKKIVLTGFTFEEMFEVRKYGTYVKSDFPNDEQRERVIKAIDPEGTKFFMFSLDENPNWDMQERLMEVGERYHLG